MTPNPIAAGIPTSGTPLLIDISSSITTNGMCGRLHKAGQQFGDTCMLDAAGHASRDPGLLACAPPGTILPLGSQSGRQSCWGTGGPSETFPVVGGPYTTNI